MNPSLVWTDTYHRNMKFPAILQACYNQNKLCSLLLPLLILHKTYHLVGFHTTSLDAPVTGDKSSKLFDEYLYGFIYELKDD